MEELPELELPSPFHLLMASEKPSIYINILMGAGMIVGAGVVMGLMRRVKQRRQRRGKLEQSIAQWMQEKESERASREAFLKQTGEIAPTDTEPLQFGMDEVFEMWKEADGLCCHNRHLLRELLVSELNREIPQALAKAAEDWRCEKRLAQSMKYAQALRVEKDLGALWLSAKETNSRMKGRNRVLLFRIMVLSSRWRLLGVALTSIVAFASDRIECAVSDTYSQWLECYLHCASHSMILKISSVNLVLCLASALVTFGSEKISALLLSRFKKETDRKLYQALSAMDMEFFDTYTEKEVNQIADLTGDLLEADHKLHNTVRNVVRICSKVRTVASYSMRLASALAGLCVLYQGVNMAVEQATALSGAAAEEEEVAEPEGPKAIVPAMMDLYMVLQNIKVLRAFNCERDIIQSLLAKQRGVDDETNRTLIVAVVECMGTWALSGIRLWGVWHAAWLVQAKLMECPTAQMNNLVTQGFTAFQEFTMLNFGWIDEFAGNAAILLQILECKPKIEREDGLMPKELKGAVEFRNVEFSYPTNPDMKILKGLSFKIEPGEYVGLVGPSGGGKSTTMQLIQRLYDPTAGQVLLDGVDLREYNPRWLRSQTAVVSQDVRLFEMTIEDNLRLANPSATKDQIYDAARKARCYDFVMRLPCGFSTMLSGCQLSGGQRQRLSIARALLMNARLLLLDEATSALDAVSQKEVQLALDAAMKGKTCFSITHRLSTVRNATSLVVIKAGVCAEKGTHDALMELNGVYAGLVGASGGGHGATPTTPKSGASTADGGEPGIPENLPHTVDASVLVSYSREFQGLCRKLEDLKIHNNTLEYPPAVRHAVEKVIQGMQDAVGRMGKHEKGAPIVRRRQGLLQSKVSMVMAGVRMGILARKGSQSKSPTSASARKDDATFAPA